MPSPGLWQFGLGHTRCSSSGRIRKRAKRAKRAARFVTGNYSYESGSMTGILGQLNGNSSRKGGKTIDLYYYIKVFKVKPVYQQMTLSPKLGVLEISTL